MIGKNISLRAMEPADADMLYKWENDTSVWLVSNTIEPFSRFVLEQYIMNAHQDIYTSKQLRLMIDKNDSDIAIGTIDLFDFDPKNLRAGLAILICNEERNKGYASEALEMMIDYAFQTLHLHQLYCNISIDNRPSIKLFKSKGFQLIGLKKEWVQRGDKWIDEYMFQLIKK
ncbi:GNAT family N-acetyltransferase [Bacteroidota bacterium]